MLSRIKSEVAPIRSASPEQFEVYCTTFRQRQDALLLISQLNQMAKAVQRHRGMSMGILAGSTLFKGDFDVLQRQVERRLSTLQMFAKQTTGLLSAREKENLHNAWLTIRADWQDDDVIDNFELHSHFIEQLRHMVINLAALLEKPVSVVAAELAGIELSGDSEHDNYPLMFKQIELINFALREVPSMVEQVARIRGLSTYAAAKGECDYHHDRKLRYAIACAKEFNEKLRLQAQRLQGEVLNGELPGLALVKTYELKLMFLLDTVDSDILSGREITANSHSLFKLATEIIDVYLQIVDDAMVVIGQWHQEDLERWLKLG